MELGGVHEAWCVHWCHSITMRVSRATAAGRQVSTAWQLAKYGALCHADVVALAVRQVLALSTASR
jgi:hypothetical protein